MVFIYTSHPSSSQQNSHQWKPRPLTWPHVCGAMLSGCVCMCVCDICWPVWEEAAGSTSGSEIFSTLGPGSRVLMLVRGQTFTKSPKTRREAQWRHSLTKHPINNGSSCSLRGRPRGCLFLALWLFCAFSHRFYELTVAQSFSCST